MGSNKILKNIIDTTWRPELAYVVGLITSDGFLHNKVPRIGITSKEMEMINLFRHALNLKNVVNKSARGGETEKKYFHLCFKSRQFYQFLLGLGLTPAKSKTIRTVNIPDLFFADFLRGLMDGDGTFWTHWDKRWPNSFVYHLEIASASPAFIKWLKKKLTTLYGVKGFMHQGKGVKSIRYVKGDSRKLYEIMYYKPNLMFLTRKYNKIKTALDFDLQLKQSIHTPR